MKDIRSWDWNVLFSLLLITVNSPQFINEFAKTRIMAEMELFFVPSTDEASFIKQPITVGDAPTIHHRRTL